MFLFLSLSLTSHFLSVQLHCRLNAVFVGEFDECGAFWVTCSHVFYYSHSDDVAAADKCISEFFLGR